jgi:hypothetical protein
MATPRRSELAATIRAGIHTLISTTEDTQGDARITYWRSRICDVSSRFRIHCPGPDFGPAIETTSIDHGVAANKRVAPEFATPFPPFLLSFTFLFSLLVELTRYNFRSSEAGPLPPSPPPSCLTPLPLRSPSLTDFLTRKPSWEDIVFSLSTTTPLRPTS